MLITLEMRPRRVRKRTGARTVLASALSDEHWSVIADQFVEEPTGGRPRIAPRPCLEGML